MDSQNLDRMAALLNAIGETILSQARPESKDWWLYAEAGDAWLDEALFKIAEGTLEWVDIAPSLYDPIMALWDAAEPSKRWEAMEFEIHGTEFKTRFWHSGELNPDEDALDRRLALIQEKFGNFKVIYPPDPFA